MKMCQGDNYQGCPHNAQAKVGFKFCRLCYNKRYSMENRYGRSLQAAREVEPESLPITKIDAFVTKLSNYVVG